MVMNFWKKPLSLSALTRMNQGTAAEHLGIEFLEVGENTLTARVPVDQRTCQPFGVIHGGVNVVLAETLGSCAAYHACPQEFHCVGLDINANHMASVKSGFVTGVTYPLHVGSSTHVWAIDLRDDSGRLTCVSRLTVAILRTRSTP
jgi:1,4-dihydroxy-2-naphthoyl-CoA hydrolase